MKCPLAHVHRLRVGVLRLKADAYWHRGAPQWSTATPAPAKAPQRYGYLTVPRLTAQDCDSHLPCGMELAHWGVRWPMQQLIHAVEPGQRGARRRCMTSPAVGNPLHAQNHCWTMPIRSINTPPAPKRGNS